MESENVKINQLPESIETNLIKPEIDSTHALGLQDLYKAAFSQEAVTNLIDFNGKATIVRAATNLNEESEEKYFDGPREKTEGDLVKSENVSYKSPPFDETYQLYSLKGLEYSVDFIKPKENSLDLNPLIFEEGKIVEGGGEVLTGYESFQNNSNSVLDLDKGIQIHLVKADGTPVESTPTATENPLLTYNYENCTQYGGDSHILQRYLCDSGSLSNSDGTVETVALNFLTKQGNDLAEKVTYGGDTVGVSPETLGVRFEDCDFNSSDSFASTESIIPKTVNCPKCPKKFMFKSDLLRHDKHKHSVKPKLFCKHCKKEFVSRQNLLFHEKSHGKKRNSYECETCKKVFKKSSLLVKHTIKKHSSTTTTSSSSSSSSSTSSSSSPSSSASASSKGDSLACDQCGKRFSSRTSLDGHLRKSHPTEREKPFECGICSKRFEKRQGLSCHAKAHLSEDHRFHVCLRCGKSFPRMGQLKNHEKSHREEKESGFVCEACGKDCKNSAALEEHGRKHTGEKPFTCNVCMKRFAYKAYFKVHIKKHSEVKPFSCGQCPKSFAGATELSKHEKSHHSKKQKSNGSKSQEVFTQTTEFVDGSGSSGSSNLLQPHVTTLHNVNVIVDQIFPIHHHQQQQQPLQQQQHQQSILLTSIGNLISSNSVPVILTRNSTESYSVSSIT